MRADVIDFGPLQARGYASDGSGFQMPRPQLGRPATLPAAGVRKHAFAQQWVFADPMPNREAAPVVLLTATRKSASQAAGRIGLPGGHESPSNAGGLQDRLQLPRASMAPTTSGPSSDRISRCSLSRVLGNQKATTRQADRLGRRVNRIRSAFLQSKDRRGPPVFQSAQAAVAGSRTSPFAQTGRAEAARGPSGNRRSVIDSVPGYPQQRAQRTPMRRAFALHADVKFDIRKRRQKIRKQNSWAFDAPTSPRSRLHSIRAAYPQTGPRLPRWATRFYPSHCRHCSRVLV